MRLIFIRTTSANNDFMALVKFLDAELQLRDGDEHSFYAAYNKIDMIKHVVVAYIEEKAVGCGAFKTYTPEIAEIKRMFVFPEYRGKGVASMVLGELEHWAWETGFSSCILETGKRQPEAIALYEKNGYHRIPNYGQYATVDNSVCFEKKVSDHSAIL